MVNRLADTAAAPAPSFHRQSTLDERIQERILTEIARLREEEELVWQQIEHALEKENLDRESAGAEKAVEEGSGDGEESAPLGSVVLLGDLEEVWHEVDKFHAIRESAVAQHASEAAQAAFTCYKCVPPPLELSFQLCSHDVCRNNPARPLDCWREVGAFQQAVGDMERVIHVTLFPRKKPKTNKNCSYRNIYHLYNDSCTEITDI